MRIVLRLGLLAGLVAVIYLAASAITSTPAGPETQADFTDAHGLILGNDVRIDGAPVGRVDAITLTSRGTALVTMRLNDGLSAPRADATAAVRPVDLLGDTYVALEPGHAAAPLRGPIPTARTLNDPRLDDLLRVFRQPQRAGMKAILVELGIALDGRGVDLNQAALDLRPTLAAADNVMQELGSQNANLQSFVSDAERVAAQASARQRDLGTLVNSLAATLRTTATHASGLDTGLQTMPATLIQARRTASELADTAHAARPLSQLVAGAADQLSSTATQLPPFLGDLTAAARNLRPTLRTAAAVLVRGDPTLAALARGLQAIAAAGPDLRSFLSALVPAAPGIAQGFFVNFPNQASEPGRQPLDPSADARRDYWRGAAVFTCQSFGLPIAPGCLTKFLAANQSPRARRSYPVRAAASPARAAQLGLWRPQSPSQASPGGRLGALLGPGATAKLGSPVVPSGAIQQLLNYLLRR